MKALALAALGLHVFPAREKDEWVGDKLYESKSPYTVTGFKEATTDPETIKAWWDQWPDALVGYAAGPSGLVILDIDIDEAKGLDGMQSIQDAGLALPETLHYETRRGGEHLVYSGPSDLAPRQNYRLTSGAVLKGVDRRSGGSYAIWWGDVPESLESVTEVPEWFTHNTKAPASNFYQGTVADWLDQFEENETPTVYVQNAIDQIPQDDFGHADMIRIQTHFVKLAAEGNSGVVVGLNALLKAWLRAPYTTQEYLRDFETALAGAVAKFGGVTEEEKEFWTRRDSLAHIHDSSRKLMASPWALLGGAMLRTIHTIPYHVQYKSNFGPASLNMINVFIGDSGGGKSLLQAQLDQVFNFGRDFVAHEVGSGEAIAETYAVQVDKASGEPSEWGNEHHAEMFSFDEIGRLNAMSNRSGGTTVLEYLKTGWSGGRLGRRLVGGKGIEVPANQYRMTAFLNAQPERADMLLSESEIEGGFPGRVMWVSLQDASLVTEYRPGAVQAFPVPCPAWGADEVIEALPAMNDAHHKDRISFHTGKRNKLEGHELMLRVRIAISLMILDGRKKLNEEDWELAETVLNHSRKTRRAVQQKIADKSKRAVESRGRAAGTRDAIAKEASEEHLSEKARTQIEAAIEKMQADGENPTKGRVKSKITRSLKPFFEDIWNDLHPDG